MKTAQHAMMVLSVVGLLAIPAFGQNAGTIAANDAALMTRAQGKVNIANPQYRPATTYSKLREGERVVMDNGAEVQLVYFSSNQLETWSGKKVFVIGKEFSKAIEGNPDQIKTLPLGVVKQLTKFADNKEDGVIQGTRYGMVRLRIDRESQKKLAEAEYQRLKNEGVGSVLPVIYLADRLYELRLDKELIELLNQTNAEQPQNEELQALTKYYRELIDTATPSQ